MARYGTAACAIAMASHRVNTRLARVRGNIRKIVLAVESPSRVAGRTRPARNITALPGWKRCLPCRYLTTGRDLLDGLRRERILFKIHLVVFMVLQHASRSAVRRVLNGLVLVERGPWFGPSPLTPERGVQLRRANHDSARKKEPQHERRDEAQRAVKLRSSSDAVGHKEDRAEVKSRKTERHDD